MALIHTLQAREVFESRGMPTIEVTLWLDNGISVVSVAPAGTTSRKHQCQDLRDQDKTRFLGKGVRNAVNLANTIIAPRLRGLDPSQQGQIDQILLELDGTQFKTKLGANTMIAVSQAVCLAGAAMYQLPVYDYLIKKYQLVNNAPGLPNPITTLINGGLHGATNLDFLDFQIIPSSRFSFSEAFSIGVTAYQALEQTLVRNNAIHSVGEQGGFTPNLYSNLDAMEAMFEAVKTTPHEPGHDVFFGIDAGANNLFKNNHYTIKDRSKAMTSDEFIDYYQELNRQYHLFILEDPFADEDWAHWSKLVQNVGRDTMILSDDLTTSNPDRINTAVEKSACSAVTVKPNQIGTITETIQIVSQIKNSNLTLVIANRYGETTDSFIADLAVGVGAEYVKFGAPARGERIAKYNRLLQIESQLQTSTQQS